jgi:hypothetical protein
MVRASSIASSAPPGRPRRGHKREVQSALLATATIRIGPSGALPGNLERGQRPVVAAASGRGGVPMRRPKQFETVRASLPVEKWNEEVDAFRFGLPGGWDCPEGGLTLPAEPGMLMLTGVTNWRPGDPLAGEVPVTARPYLCMFVLDNTSLTGWEAAQEFEQVLANPDGLARHRAGRLGQRPRGPAARILLDGQRAVLLQYAGWDHAYGCGWERVNIGRSEIFALSPLDRPILMMYQGALELHDQCLAELYTMLGSWEWLPRSRTQWST